MTDQVNLECKWNKQRFKLVLPANTTLSQLKTKLYELTQVKPQHQKLLQIPKKPDSTKLSELNLKKPVHSFLLVGNPEQVIIDANKVCIKK